PDSAASGYTTLPDQALMRQCRGFSETGCMVNPGSMTKPNILRGLAPDTVLLLCYWWFFAGVSH
ncbi:MAG: hypothetical protein ACO3EL_05720, partial [Burkholderiaceae bacterium]